jgi:hypothetical protein
VRSRPMPTREWAPRASTLRSAQSHSSVSAPCSHIDCAAGYGNEKEVGEALQELFARGVVKRADVWVTSKLWVSNAYPVDKIAPALEKTLSDLQLEYLVRAGARRCLSGTPGRYLPIPATLMLTGASMAFPSAGPVPRALAVLPPAGVHLPCAGGGPPRLRVRPHVGVGTEKGR